MTNLPYAVETLLESGETHVTRYRTAALALTSYHARILKASGVLAVDVSGPGLQGSKWVLGEVAVVPRGRRKRRRSA